MSQVALITRGGGGIGRAVAHRMAAGGIAVVVADYDHGAAEQVSGEIKSAGGKAEALAIDVTVAREIKAVVTDVAKRYGHVDILANIAGGSFYTKRLEEFSWAEWKEVIDVNLKGTFLMCREVAPIMQKQKSGRIVNTASNYGVTGSELRMLYASWVKNLQRRGDSAGLAFHWAVRPSLRKSQKPFIFWPRPKALGLPGKRFT